MNNHINFLYKKIIGEVSYKVYEFWSVYYVEVYINEKHVESRLYTLEQLKKEFLLK